VKGLEVARRFFDEWGLVYLRSEFPRISERVAAFVYGGSQSLGNDDELSCDHGWGPGFTLVLTGQDMRRYGPKLRKAIESDAPTEWLGYAWQRQSNIVVHPMDKWFRQNIGCAHPPKRPDEWLRRTNENYLYMLRHASILHDPLGEFTARRKSFWYYPRPAWLTRIGTETFNVWHYGQYNFLERLTQRRDRIAIAACLGTFIQATMALCLLLADNYTPYWKWLAAEFRKLPDVAELESHLSELSKSNDIAVQASHVDFICKDIYARLLARGLVGETPTGHHHPLFCAVNEIQSTV